MTTFSIRKPNGMSTNLNKIHPVWRFLVALTISIIVAVTTWIFSKFQHPPKLYFFASIAFILMTYGCLEVVRFSQIRFYKLLNLPSKVLNNSIVFLGSIALGTLSYTVLFYPFKWFDYWVYNSEPPKWQHFLAAALIGLIISIIFALMQFGMTWLGRYYEAYIENERFKKEMVKANLSILKQQLDPHFMFNNFNTLYYLIDEDKVLAKQFLKNISTIYRYILQNNDASLVSAMDEYQITKQYLYVLRQRFSKSLLIKDIIDLDDIKDKKLPPLVLQQLVENAVKHNKIDETTILQISLSSNGDSLTVRNNVNKKAFEPSSKSGLNNIQKRYKHLNGEGINITNNPEEFSVSIPLI